RLEEAVREYRTATRLDPDFVEARTNLGAIYASQGRLDEAIVELEKAVVVNPNHREAHTNLAIIYHLTKQLDKARAHFKRAEELGYRFHQETGEALKEATSKLRP
ncbi:MAG: tetratricopeptide repeat protein, partial [Candidatus Tectimicrobiota bacterium]